MQLIKVFPGTNIIEKYPYSLDDLRMEYSNINIPTIITEDILSMFNLKEVYDSIEPEYDKDLYRLKKSNYPDYMDGKWILNYQLEELSSIEVEELNKKKNELEKIKQKEERFKQRAEEVSNIIVQTQSGNDFNGDEESQSRMSRAILAMQLGNITSINWKLADNNFREITLEELSEALILSGTKQSEIWNRYN